MINLPIISEIPVADEKTIWRSLDDLADTPELHEFAKKEFPGFANVYEGLGEAEVEEGALSRRQFLALSAAGLGLAGLSGCRTSTRPAFLVPEPHFQCWWKAMKAAPPRLKVIRSIPPAWARATRMPRPRFSSCIRRTVRAR